MQYYYMKNTLQEIADSEGTTKQSVYESIQAALDKLRRKSHEM